MKKLFSLLIFFIAFSINAQIITNVDKLRINEITEMQEAGKILVVDSDNVVQWISENKITPDLSDYYTKIDVDAILEDYYDKGEIDATIETVLSLAPHNYNFIGVGDHNSPVVKIGNESDWDAIIREIGNVVIHDDVYYFTYTGYQAPYDEETYIGLATSTDGISWEKKGKITLAGFEDPFLVIKDDIWYLYSEKKLSSRSHAGINLHTGSDILNLTDKGVVFDKVSGLDWQDIDVSSPTVTISDGVFYMFYEGRGDGQGGSIGLASSSDGISWDNISNLPIISGINYDSSSYRVLWAVDVVPDDIFNIEGVWYLSFHARSGGYFVSGLISSLNPFEIGVDAGWKDSLGTYITTGLVNNTINGSGIPYFISNNKLSALYSTSSGVYKGYLSTKTGVSEIYNSQDANPNSYRNAIFPKNRNEYINLNITRDVEFIIMNDANSGAGIVKKVFRSDENSFELNVKAGDGVKLDGVEGASISVEKGDILEIISIGTNDWITVSLTSRLN